MADPTSSPASAAHRGAKPLVRFSLVWRVALVAAALAMSVTVVTLRRGALRATWEANLSARASTLAVAPASRTPEVFPGLAAGGNVWAQVWDDRGNSVWRSPSLGTADLTHKPYKLYRIRSDAGPAAGTTWGSTVRVIDADGASFTAVYQTADAPFAYETARTSVLVAVFVFLPALLVAVLCPWPRRPEPLDRDAVLAAV